MKRTKALWVVMVLLGTWFAGFAPAAAASAPKASSTDTGGNGYDG